MAAIATLTEDFATGSVGATVGAGYGQVDAASGTGSSVTATGGMLGLRAVDITTSATFRILTFNHAAAGGWRMFGYEIATMPAAAVAIFSCYNAGTKANDVRQQADGTLQIRDGSSNSRFVSTPLTVGQKYIIGLRVDSAGNGGHRLKIYNADTGALVQDSGALTNAGFAQAATTELRLGLQSSSTGRIKISRLRGDDAAEPDKGISLPNPVVAYTRSTVTTINTAGSNGTMSLTQTSGPTATISGSVGGVFTITHPEPLTSSMTFNLVANDAGVTATQVITIAVGAAKAVWVSNGSAFI